MAYNQQILSPLDLKRSTGIGVKIPFENDSAFTTVYSTKEQTKYNLINFMLTDNREIAIKDRQTKECRSQTLIPREVKALIDKTSHRT